MSILLVEDNVISAKALEVSLQKGGYETILARSGKEALDCLQKHAQIKLVITDIMMPDMDGLELIRTIRERPGLNALPVIFVTASADTRTVTQATQLGCLHYLIKPIRSAQLLEKVREVAETRKAILRNRFQVIKESGLEAHSYNEIIKDFTEQVDRVIGKLESGPNLEVAPELLSEVVALREGAGLVGAERLEQTLDQLSLTNEAAKGIMPSNVLEELKVLRGALRVASSK